MIFLIDKTVDAFIGDKDQYIIYRAACRIDVGPAIHRLYMTADGREKLFFFIGARTLILRGQKAVVLWDGVHGVHVSPFAFGQVKSEIRSITALSFLFVKVDAFNQAEQIQDVFHHPLPPLTARLAPGENLAKQIGGFREVVQSARGAFHRTV